MSHTAKGKYEYWLTPEGLIKLEGWARDGLTDEQIAQNIGINPATLYDWKNKYDEISETLKRGKEVVDFEVENALLKRALGYKTTEQRLNKDGELVEVEKEMPPDVTAQIFWLKNRKPDKWRDKVEAETGNEKSDELMERLIDAVKRVE